MYISHEGQNLYFKPWDFNCCRVFTRLAKIVVERGGKYAPTHYFYAHNRLRNEIIEDCRQKITRYTELNQQNFSQRRADAILEYQNKLSRALNVSDEPFRATHGHSISFILDGFYYSYSVDTNPLFPYIWGKTPLRNGMYSRDAVHDEAPHDWCYDQLWEIDCTDAVIDICANQILEFLLKSKPSPIRRDRECVTVPNTYDDDWHTEWKLMPERMASTKGW